MSTFKNLKRNLAKYELEEQKWWQGLIDRYFPNKPLVPIRIWIEFLNTLLVLYSNTWNARSTLNNLRIIQLRWTAEVESAILALPQSCNYTQEEKDIELETTKFALDNIILRLEGHYGQKTDFF